MLITYLHVNRETLWLCLVRLVYYLGVFFHRRLPPKPRINERVDRPVGQSEATPGARNAGGSVVPIPDTSCLGMLEVVPCEVGTAGFRKTEPCWRGNVGNVYTSSVLVPSSKARSP